MFTETILWCYYLVTSYTIKMIYEFSHTTAIINMISWKILSLLTLGKHIALLQRWDVWGRLDNRRLTLLVVSIQHHVVPVSILPAEKGKRWLPGWKEWKGLFTLASEEQRTQKSKEIDCRMNTFAVHRFSKGLIPRIEKPQRLHIRPALVVPACKCWCLEVLGKKVVGLRKALAIEWDLTSEKQKAKKSSTEKKIIYHFRK